MPVQPSQREARGANPRAYSTGRAMLLGEGTGLFDEREQETEPCQTGLRRALRKQSLRLPPGDYRYCACARLHSKRRVGRKIREL
jgi:hypothetical protein